MKPADSLQNDIVGALLRRGYRLKEQVCAQIYDPFAWYVIAEKDDYEIRIEERAKSLVEPERV